ncbi:MAG TPA: serine/threonine-protein kinase [Candidatus Obscuribacterales bacterium]
MERRKTKAIKLTETCAVCRRPISNDGPATLINWVLSDRCRCKGNEAARLARTRTLTAESPPEAVTTELCVGTLIDERYEIVDVLGRGGMGVVLRAKDTFIDRTVAVKVLHQGLMQDAVMVKRFQREAEASAALDHPGAVAVYSHGVTSSGAPYLVMECIEGDNLGNELRNGALGAERTLDLSMQICEALSHAHMHGLVHRDIKPSNIIIKKTEGGGEAIKLVDFGLAKVMYGQNMSSQKLTSTGEIFGSPNYMSPEQCVCERVDERADIYSLGCLMYHCLTGKPPFDGNNPVQVVLSHLDEKPAPFADGSSGRMAHLESVVLKCLEKSADDRYATMNDLKRDLVRLDSGFAPTLAGRAWYVPRMPRGAALIFPATYCGLILFSLLPFLPGDRSVLLMIGLSLATLHWATTSMIKTNRLLSLCIRGRAEEQDHAALISWLLLFSGGSILGVAIIGLIMQKTLGIRWLGYGWDDLIVMGISMRIIIGSMIALTGGVLGLLSVRAGVWRKALPKDGKESATNDALPQMSEHNRKQIPDVR